ncbi:flagellar motor protein MotB [Parvularcula sp. LCG005]|uniref:flagellar motor protein MotB n=1 Tax=Parvularcula sp. LCG005 TaxID=3078805 RepID=UPI0029432569|nr:flagellar motor protein MotB [Parvularcula sp. LCG005]WOI52705.1 flagellar motor protein MotB [Parvularcula sp. LCG005]
MSANQAPIIIKRKKVIKAAGHHGGAWKVAYADFVTAMMAFFLLMWLLNATTEEQRKGLADYFNPSIPIAAVSGGGTDALNGDSVLTEENFSQSNDYLAIRQDTVIPATEDLKAEIAKIAEQAGITDAEGRVRVTETEEGTLIELVDVAGKPLFGTGSAMASDDLNKLIAATAIAVEKTGAAIKITGHTDGVAYANNQGYTNWELSADRANTARRMLIAAGVMPRKIREVSGRADREPIGEGPNDPINRRIAIVLLDPSKARATSSASINDTPSQLR